jgi:hypothetical protein
MSDIGQGNLRSHRRRFASLIPPWTSIVKNGPLRGILAPNVARRGLYVSQFFGSSILGYSSNNAKNGGPICSVTGAVSPNNIAVDGEGNLIVPNANGNVSVFAGPGMCGPGTGSFQEPNGQPVDAASANAITGTIAVGNIYDQGQSPGSISICTMAASCTKTLTNPNIYQLASVAMSKGGDCWADGTDKSGIAHLIYFAKCDGSGKATRGFKNSSYGGLDIDSSGRLVTIDALANMVYVYSGCNPRCKLFGSPQALFSGGSSTYGRLNKKSSEYAASDYQLGQVDIYEYSSGKLTYRYSFNSGLDADYEVLGIAFNPRSTQ